MTLHTAEVAAFSLLATFVLACVLYVLFTFALGWRSASKSLSFWARLRIMARELRYTIVYQAIQPWFYLAGRKMGDGDGQPIVLLHGYFQNRVAFFGLVRGLRKRGLGPFYGFNYPWLAPTEANVARLALFIERVRAETGHASVDLIAHSMGGLIALDYIADPRYQTHVRRCVTIASPHGGIPWRGPILGAASHEIRAASPYLLERRTRLVGVPCLSIFSPTDNVVYPATTSTLAARGGTDFEIPTAGHFSILFDHTVHDKASEFLREMPPASDEPPAS